MRINGNFSARTGVAGNDFNFYGFRIYLGDFAAKTDTLAPVLPSTERKAFLLVVLVPMALAGTFAWRTVHVQIAGPPAVLTHVDEPLHHHRALVLGILLDGETAETQPVFRTPLQFILVTARTELQFDLAVEDEMVLPRDRFGRHDRFAAGILEVHSHRDQLSRILVGHADFQLTLAHIFERAGRTFQPWECRP